MVQSEYIHSYDRLKQDNSTYLFSPWMHLNVCGCLNMVVRSICGGITTFDRLMYSALLINILSILMVNWSLCIPIEHCIDSLSCCLTCVHFLSNLILYLFYSPIKVNSNSSRLWTQFAKATESRSVAVFFAQHY